MVDLDIMTSPEWSSPPPYLTIVMADGMPLEVTPDRLSHYPFKEPNEAFEHVFVTVRETADAVEGLYVFWDNPGFEELTAFMAAHGKDSEEPDTDVGDDDRVAYMETHMATVPAEDILNAHESAVRKQIGGTTLEN
jgi:hypothetical protein